MDIAVATATLGAVGLQASFANTILRSRGTVFCELDATAVNERVIVMHGLILVSENAFQAGAASVPHPFTDTDDDWIWTGQTVVSSGEETAVNENSLFDRVEVDSKAMRKVKSGEVYVFVSEIAQSQDQGGSVNIIGAIRMLSGN